jgi:NAD(P)-dependent dehydrogenase (short-subunit alcohol dehydrogenase family)
MKHSQTVLVTGAGSGIGRAIAVSLARAGHCVYASMRSMHDRNRARADELRGYSQAQQLDLRVIELDVLSEASCRAAVDQVLYEREAIDVVVNSAGMLMTGMTEAFSPEQVLQILNTNAISWLRVNRAALPAMRRRKKGLLVYVGSTTSSIHEPFMGPYIASKAAGDALAEVMAFEVSPLGIESVIVVPGAFTTGTEHFAHAQGPQDAAVVTQYEELKPFVSQMPSRLEQIDSDNGGAIDVSSVGEAVARLLEMPRGQRPSRVVVDGQQKGIEQLNELHREKQAAFFEKLGVRSLLQLPEAYHEH